MGRGRVTCRVPSTTFLRVVVGRSQCLHLQLYPTFCHIPIPNLISEIPNLSSNELKFLFKLSHR